MLRSIHPLVKLEKKLHAMKSLDASLGRHKRGSLLRLIFVYIPTVFTAFYLFFLHTPMYVSETSFALRSGDNADMSSIAGLFLQTASNTVQDSFILQDYIVSMDMLEKVDREINIKAHYADPSRDIYSRLKRSPTKEELLEYWQWLVTASFTPEKGIIDVEAKAYDPETARSIGASILAQSEKLVNEMNDRARQDSLRLMRAEVKTAQVRVLEARETIRQFRDEHSILDPKATGAVLEGVVATLEGEAAKAQAKLNAALKTMTEDNPQAKQLRIRLDAIREQLAQEKNRLAGLGGADSLSSVVGDYARLLTEEKFAEEQLIHAMAAFEAARLKTITQARYIVPFQPPILPEESLYPRPVLFTVLVFFGLFLTLGLVSLIIASIKDHMGVI